MAGYTSETMLTHTLMTNGFWEDGLALALILAQHCLQRFCRRIEGVCIGHHTGT